VRACFDVSTETRACRAWVTVGRRGHVFDIQASDHYDAGTGDEALDRFLGSLAGEELTRARSVAVIASFDRKREAT